jgi:hypothetical protein
LDKNNARGGRNQNIGGMGKMKPALTLIKRQENEVPRDELLLRDVTKMFWELRGLREEVRELKKENHYLRSSNTHLIKSNNKLRYERDLINLSDMYGGEI